MPRCSGHTGPWEDCEEQDSRSGKAILQDSLKDFSASVYAELKGSKPQTNLIFSPISIAVALYNLLLGETNNGGTSYSRQKATHCTLLSCWASNFSLFASPSFQGARGETRTQLEGALRIPSGFSCVHSETKKLKKEIKGTLGMASAIFYSPGSRSKNSLISQPLTLRKRTVLFTIRLTSFSQGYMLSITSESLILDFILILPKLRLQSYP